MSKLEIRYGGKTIVAETQDIGAPLPYRSPYVIDFDAWTPSVERLGLAYTATTVDVQASMRKLRAAYGSLATRRCPTCYLPMRYEFECDWFTCWLCGAHTTGEALAGRSRWQRRVDWLTGMDS